MHANWLNQTDRPTQLRNLSSHVFDVLVIGGGITGAGVVRDAAMRGLSVALIEAQDFASGTSSRSSKMIHGGLRYLVSGDIEVVRESASERNILHRIAPHLAQKTPYVIPTGSLRSKWLIRSALWAYERLGGVNKEDFHNVWSVSELIEREPLIEARNFNGAVVYPEFLTDDARLTLATIRSSVAHGASVATYLRATDIRRENEFIVDATSTLPNEIAALSIRARALVNAAGPWVDAVCGLEKKEPARLALSRGVHLVFDRSNFPIQHTIVMRTHDKRRIFAVPLGAYTYIGTTDDYYPNTEYWPPVTHGDVSYLLDSTHRIMPSLSLTPDQIVSVWSGIRPLVSDGSGRPSKELSRKDEIWESRSGMLSIGGGKLSAYRAMSERIVDRLVKNNGFVCRPCATANESLPGGSGVPTLKEMWKGFTEPDMKRLVRLYGGELNMIEKDSEGEADTVVAEAHHAVMAEGALRLEDYWARRSSRAWFDYKAGLPVLERAAAAMAGLLNWDEARMMMEINNCRSLDAQSRGAFMADKPYEGHAIDY